MVECRICRTPTSYVLGALVGVVLEIKQNLPKPVYTTCLIVLGPGRLWVSEWDPAHTSNRVLQCWAGADPKDQA
jgi:hypothetical protein